jgi:hypothetical protein
MKRTIEEDNYSFVYYQWFNGAVTDDGFAYGIVWDSKGRSNSWRSGGPAACFEWR